MENNANSRFYGTPTAFNGSHHSVGGENSNYAKKKKMEHYTTTTSTTTTSSYRAKAKKMKESFESMRGVPYGGPEIMLDNKMMKGEQDKVARAHNVDNARFVTPEAKQKNELDYKGQTVPSRFYSNKKVKPEAIGADIGPARLAIGEEQKMNYNMNATNNGSSDHQTPDDYATHKDTTDNGARLDSSKPLAIMPKQEDDVNFY